MIDVFTVISFVQFYIKLKIMDLKNNSGHADNNNNNNNDITYKEIMQVWPGILFT